MTTNDPFSSINGSITPLNIGSSNNEYSIKIITRKNGTTDDQVNVFVGTFNSDIYTNAIGFQSSIMTTIESGIQQIYDDSFLIGPLPSLGKPSNFILQGDDILVSFSKKNNYFIFNGTGSSREVKFITIGEPEVSYLPGVLGAPFTYTFDSHQYNTSYIVSYPSYGIFTITDNNGRITNFDYSNNSVITYEGILLTETIHGDGTKTYKNNPYTDIGITILPSILPINSDDIIVAEGVTGFFYNENTVTDFNDLIDYINVIFPTFSISQKNCISKFIKNIFNPVRNAIYHILHINNRDSYSINNGFASYTSIGGIMIETRVT